MATPQGSDDVLMKIVETVECPVCLNTIWKPPIYHCEQGHIFCGDCNNKLREGRRDCPVCREPLSGKRAFAVEQIVSQLATNQCKNGGCDFKAPLKVLVESHEDSCQQRLVDCYICSTRVIIKQLPVHLKTHDNHCSVEGKGWHTLRYFMKRREDPPMSCNRLERTTANGEKFIFYRLLSGGRYLLWVSHCHDKEDTEGFEYTISILCGKKRDQSKTFRLVRHTGLCLPMDTSLGAIKQDQMCLSVPENFIRNALDKRGHYWCELRVVSAKQNGNMAK